LRRSRRGKGTRMNVLRAGALEVGLACAEQWLEEILARRYGPWLRPGKGEGDVFSVAVEASAHLSPGYDPAFRVRETREETRVASSFMEFVFHPRRREGLLRVAADRDRAVDSLENALRVSIQHVGSLAGSFLVHAACAGEGGRCVLMPASEGGGKSTIAARCARAGMDVYGDDLVMVAREEGQGLTAWSTPFRGEAACAFHAGHARVAGVLFLRKEKGSRIDPLSRAAAAGRFVSNVPYIGGIPPSCVERLLETAAAAGRRAGEFSCDLSSHPADAVRRYLRGWEGEKE